MERAPKGRGEKQTSKMSFAFLASLVVGRGRKISGFCHILLEEERKRLCGGRGGVRRVFS